MLNGIWPWRVFLSRYHGASSLLPDDRVARLGAGNQSQSGNPVKTRFEPIQPIPTSFFSGNSNLAILSKPCWTQFNFIFLLKVNNLDQIGGGISGPIWQPCFDENTKFENGICGGGGGGGAGSRRRLHEWTRVARLGAYFGPNLATPGMNTQRLAARGLEEEEEKKTHRGSFELQRVKKKSPQWTFKQKVWITVEKNHTDFC